ncbi:hypothetical protein MMC13_005461 [Lambiella insularis]|nr:hypothetical protein [Lambiella insularis]
MDGESHKEQDERVEKLWRTLDTRNQGQLDLAGLKKGLRKMDHPLQDADALLQDVMKAVDTSKDGRIQYSEFREFVEQTEKELWHLFKSIDRDHNGQLDKTELQAAFARAGLVIPKAKFEDFFSEIDTNHDGAITFDEWRNFLLFIPTHTLELQAVLSYYTSTVKINAEGDVHISDENAHSLGRTNFLSVLFGSIFAIASPPRSHKPYSHQPYPTTSTSASTSTSTPSHISTSSSENQDPGFSQPYSFPWDPGEVEANTKQTVTFSESLDDPGYQTGVTMLTEFLPDPGYFVAGAIAGVVSRTATAPLDRLKVFLIAQTGVRDETIQAVKTGAPLKATKLASRPLIDATLQLWRMGGIRSMFAGNGLNVVKVMPESAIKFGSYEASKRAMARLEGHDDPRALNPWSQFFAAGMGGMFSQLCIYPLETLKFRVQNETVKGGLHGNALIFDTARKMVRTSGLSSFYRGLPMGLVGMFPYAAIDLTTFEYLKRFLTSRKATRLGVPLDDAAPGNIMTASIGAFSGAFGASVVYPLNLLRTRLQTQGTAIHPPTYTGVWDVTVKTVKGEGLRGLFRGLTPNLLKVVPSFAITYVVYENSKKVLGLR